MKCVFVTVGTTSFDDLIARVSAPDSLQKIESLGYNRLILQIGRGTVVPEPFSTESFTLDVYRCRKLFGDSGKRKATRSGYKRKVDEQSSAGTGKAATQRGSSLLLYLQHASWAVTVNGLINTEMLSSWPARKIFCIFG
ncbi:putative bifunctional UDP-N-acetylglucosamine transferase and deubiquitinase ALG13 isoform X10 [Pan paniscus]|uniref:putative bifunctional UDP-N-acetylglucosamine transferase and deubiquitinase ALG13 isoform X15 n=1 Tax=Pan troglodytes TaxID=9598 RepID=UPI00020E4AC2|nr:putative bifunctional UDP-N-acetylglucosamine transferase and deubiquitinase ALG13 isoform X11 [Pan troglodytes]XP_034806595.1 putative bifunctional UDP-N-acetylglucosamine transferase and deubiquitinase ALG13 isoform X9 [Pan paniscus]